MLILGTDIETTGLKYGDHRIIELHAGIWDLAGTKLKAKTWRINPERSIDIDAQRVHGISLADLSGSPRWSDVAPEIHKWFTLSSLRIIVAHNGKGFDMPFVNHEFERIGLEPILTPVFDTMLEGRWSTPTGAVPNLGALCFACGIPYDTDKAHSATYDVEVMMKAFFLGRQWGWFNHEALNLPAASVAA